MNASANPRAIELALEALSPQQQEAFAAAFRSGKTERLNETRLAVLAGAGRAIELAAAMAELPQTNPSLAVCWAAENGREEALKVALSAFEPEDFHPMAMALAIERQRAGCVALLARKTFSEDQCDALRLCAIHDNPEAADILLATGVCHPQTVYSNNVPDLGFQDPICWAAALGSTRALETLLRAREAHPSEARPLGKALYLAGAFGGSVDSAARALCFEALLPLAPADELVKQLSKLSEHGSHESCERILDVLPPSAADPHGRGPIEILLDAVQTWARRIQDVGSCSDADEAEWRDGALLETREANAEAGLKATLELLRKAVVANPTPLENGRFDIIARAQSLRELPELPDWIRGWRASAEADQLAQETLSPPPRPKTGPSL